MKFIIFVLLATVIGCKSTVPVEQQASVVTDVNVFGGEQGQLGAQILEQNGKLTATFYYEKDGAKHRFDRMHEGDVAATPIDGGYRLSFEGQDVGMIYRDKLYLCDKYQIAGKTFFFACNANFFTPEYRPSHVPDTVKLPAGNYKWDLSLASASEYSLQSDSFTLEQYAQNQISQYSTATCAYNAATGIMEILYAMNKGQRENFSEPYYLIRSPSFGQKTSWFWDMYERFDNEVGGMLRDQDLPIKQIYSSGVGFNSAESRAENYLSRNGQGSKIQLSFPMKGEKLFFHAEWSGGYMRSRGDTTDENFRKTVSWFMQNKKPVNVHYWINGIWHSVVMIGYDASRNAVLIKDSLGNTHLKGTWKSRSWFLRNVYAAIGVSDGAAPPPADTNVTDNNDVVTPPPPSTPEPPSTTPVPPAVDTANTGYQVKVRYGGREGRYQVFYLSVSGSTEALANIKSVTYSVHPTFGEHATQTVTQSSSGFESQKYMTYANGWTTRGTTITLENGRTISLVGTRISY